MVAYHFCVDVQLYNDPTNIIYLAVCWTWGLRNVRLVLKLDYRCVLTWVDSYVLGKGCYEKARWTSNLQGRWFNNGSASRANQQRMRVPSGHYQWIQLDWHIYGWWFEADSKS